MLCVVVILYSYTVGINTHECSQAPIWRAIKNAWVHCPHCPQMPAHGHGHMATWSWPASHRVVWTLPTLPPTKVVQCKDCKYRAAVGFCFLAEGPRGGPGPEGHGSGGATNKIFYSPHCPHDPQIFKFIFYVYWRRWLALPVTETAARRYG